MGRMPHERAATAEIECTGGTNYVGAALPPAGSNVVSAPMIPAAAQAVAFGPHRIVSFNPVSIDA